MPLFHELINNSTSAENLQAFVINNIQSFHDLHNSHYNNIFNEKYDIRDFIELKYKYLNEIDFEQTQCKAFISILFDFCERFGFISTTLIENTLSSRNLSLGIRREAAKLFLLQIRQDFEYVKRFEQICSHLQCSILTEEDNEVKPIVTFLNYLAKVIRDTSAEVINSVMALSKESSVIDAFPFLRSKIIQEVCAINTDDVDQANAYVQSRIESYLGHMLLIEPDIEEIVEDVVVENNTDYSSDLEGHIISFDLVRRIAVDKCISVRNDLQGRGVLPLINETEMFIYLKRYGNMHKSKLLSAFEIFPFNEVNSPVEIIDWGCGQGLASLVLIDYLKDNNIALPIRKIILIEPSELSLKRAALHVSKAKNEVPLKTVCNLFSNLSHENIQTSPQNAKFHLFSNVLDIDESIYSMSNLIDKITKTQKGENYFFCISPFINDEKADRVDSFKRYFHTNYDSFKPIFSVENSGRLHHEYWNCNKNYTGNSGVYCTHPQFGCDKKWTRVIRVFKVEL
jgi:hypothetical protein